MPTQAPRSVDLATMPVADKVLRYVQARFFAAQLSALQSEAEMCRCHFVLGGSSDHMPADVEEHLSLAVMVARSATFAPAEPMAEHHAYACARLADGSGQALLRDLLAALSALNVHFRIHPAGLNREHMEAKRMFWGVSRAVLADAPKTRAASLPVGASRHDVDQFVQSFFKELEIPSHDEP